MRHPRLDDAGLETARRVITTTLTEHFDDIVFDKILVKRQEELFGDDDDDVEFIRVQAIYFGERERLRTARTKVVVEILCERLWEAGVTAYPSPHFIMKSEWDQDPEPD